MMPDPFIDVRWRRVGKWAGDVPEEYECRSLTLRTFVSRLAKVTRRGDRVEIIKVTVQRESKEGLNN